MSIDERLRDGLKGIPIEDQPLDGIKDHVIERGRQVRWTRRIGIALGTATALAAAVLVVPRALEAIGTETDIRPAEPVPSEPSPTHMELLYVLDVVGLGFSSDGLQLFARGEDPRGVVYDVSTGQPIELLEAERGNATVGFSPDGELFVTVKGGRVAVLDTFVNTTATGEELWDFKKACCFVAFSPDGRLLAIPFDGHTRVMDLETGDTVGEFDAFGELVFSPDGRRLLVSSGEEGTVASVFDLDGGHDAVVTLEGPNDGDAFLTTLAWSPDGSTLVTATGDGRAVFWDAATGDERFVISSTEGRFTSLDYGSDPAYLATGSSDGTASVWALTSDGAETILSRDAHIGSEEWLDVELSPDGTRLMTTSARYKTTVWGIVR